MIFLYQITCLSVFINLAIGQTVESETECYTANGVDYEGTQSQIEAPLTTPETFTPCVKWSETRIAKFENLTENYCRNPDNSVFPWCFVRKDGELKKMLCRIPSCKTPAYVGCYKTMMIEESATQEPDQYIPILRSNDTALEDPKMKISRCLNYCRVRKHDYAGLTDGHSCYCGGWSSAEKADQVLNDDSNRLPQHLCMLNHCVGDPVHACGGKNAMAIYDTSAGRCGGSFKFKDHGTIYSPRWPGNYHHNLTCNWQIFVPGEYLEDEENYNITFSFVYFNLQPKKDFLSIHTFRNFFDRSPIQISKHHGKNLPDDVTISLRDVTFLMVGFESDGEKARNGFTVNFKVVSTKPRIDEGTPENENNLENIPGNSYNETTTAESSSNEEDSNVEVTTTLKKTSIETTMNPGVSAHRQSNTPVIAIGVAIAAVVVTLATVAGLSYFLKRRQKKKLSERFTQPPPDFNNPVTFDNDLKTVDVLNHNYTAAEIKCIT